jgi:hypothetical protein
LVYRFSETVKLGGGRTDRECACVRACVRALSEGTVLYTEYRVAQNSLDTIANTLNNIDCHLTFPHSANAAYY